jgi:hypothetical protein
MSKGTEPPRAPPPHILRVRDAAFSAFFLSRSVASSAKRILTARSQATSIGKVSPHRGEPSTIDSEGTIKKTCTITVLAGPRQPSVRGVPIYPVHKVLRPCIFEPLGTANYAFKPGAHQSRPKVCNFGKNPFPLKGGICGG